MANNVIIQEYSEKYGWCLFKVIYGDRDFAEICLEKEQRLNPDKQLRLTEIKKEDCWWNDPFLAN